MGRKSRNRIIDIYCRGCGSYLFRYVKEGGDKLVKCYVSNILDNRTADSQHCPKCNEEFAGLTAFHNRPAYKIVQGKVFVKE